MKNIKIYFTSDTHGFIYPTDYKDNNLKNIGLLNIINELKKDPNTLIIDGGDTIQGSPFTTFLSNKKFKDHPLSLVMNIGKYDFITLGNHDFNYGYSYLEKYLNGLNGECICSNVLDKQNKLPIKPYSIKTLENGLKLGLIGLTTEFIPIWENPQNLINIDILNSFETCKKYHDLLKDKVDLLILVYHGGFENDIDTGKSLSKTTENIAYKICKELKFDLILTGHQHMEIENKELFNTHIVQPSNNAKKYALINVDIAKNKKYITSKLITPKINPNNECLEKLLPLEKDVQIWLDTPVGFLDIPLIPKSHLEMAIEGSYLANFINDVQLEISKADISCTSFANSIKGFNKEVTIRDIVSTYIYPNTLVVLEVTGEILKKALIRSSEYFKLENGNISISENFLKPKVAHYNYDYFSNIEYTFDLNKTGAERVSSFKYKEKEIKNTDTFSLVMNNYRASGVSGYEFFKECKVLKEIQIEMPEILIAYFRKYKNVKVNKKKWIKIKY